MSHRGAIAQPVAPYFRAGDVRRRFRFARVLFLLALFLLPVQMRAGADDPHPHAALQLILDAHDGAIDHHAGRAGHEALTEQGAPDLPAFGDSSSIGTGIATLAAMVVVLLVPAQEAPDWPHPAPRLGRSPALEPPPPRLGSAWS